MRMTPVGCRLECVVEAECRSWLNHVTVDGPVPRSGHDLCWLLAHCDDGVVWGRREPGGWRLSSQPFPDVSPRLSEGNVQQFRLFGPQSEILVWRTEDGLLGRWLTHAPDGVEASLRLEKQEYILVGDRVLQPVREGFTVVGDGRGSRHAVPLVCPESQFPAQPRRHPLRLTVWHYFAADEQSGIVRIVASRLADVRLVSKENS
jgi:CRISPR-associated protein (TIGR03984 family)